MNTKQRMYRMCALVLLMAIVSVANAQLGNRGRNLPTQEDAAFYKTPEARAIAEQVLLYQRVTGGWPKNINMSRPLSDAERSQVLADKARRDDSTTDNGATTMQMRYMARMYQATKDSRYKDAFARAVEYLLSGQYENGGWPQFWPDPQGYQKHITYNDGAMYNTMMLLRRVAEQEGYYKGLSDKKLRQRCMEAFSKGVECILLTQMRNEEGELTVWCQQHDRDTYAPAKARAYELPSYGPIESADLVRLLMTLPNPDDRVKRSVHAAMKWFDKYKLTGLRIQRHGPWASMDGDTKLVEDPDAEPIWGRYYDLKYCEPYVCDRDGLPRRRLEDIGHERRNGYSWFSSRPGELYSVYEAWADKYDPRNKVSISLTTKGANENGLIEMFRQPKRQPGDFDAVVSEGESIQAAIERAPARPDSASPYKIFIRKGVYRQKVIIDRPNIVLVGEQRDSTIIVLSETAKTQTVREYAGQPVHNGVIVLQDNADDCVISGLTVYNDYGTTVEPGNTTHQMAVFGRGTRTIIVNCNIWADGNDALSLWAKEDGMYYHADLYLRCPGVDFLCPRGWCYATRCRFYGDGRAILWHDGRANPKQKLVVTNSEFDAKRPTPLGRYHHDSQFYVVNCKLSENILDQNIEHAYKGRTAEEMAKEGKVLDPCPLGQRVYYYGNKREGGHSGWLDNNLQSAPGAPEFHAITAPWTFDGQWDPEQRLRELWYVIAY